MPVPTLPAPVPDLPGARGARPAPARAREVLTVFRHEYRYLFLSVRTLVPMLIYAGFGGLSMLVFVKLAATARQKAVETGLSTEQLESGLGETLGKVLSWVGWGDEGTGAEIMRDHVPLLVLFFFALSSYFLPLLVAVVSFDQFSDLSTRGARFSLLRVRRETYFAGKALAACASVAGFLFAMWLVVIVVAAVHGGSGEVFYAVREGLRAWALMCVLALPYLALTAIVSSYAKPGLAFVGTFGAYIAMSMANTVARRLPDALQTVLLPLFPWEHAPKLISRYTPTMAAGVAALVAIALALYVLTGWLVRRRDV